MNKEADKKNTGVTSVEHIEVMPPVDIMEDNDSYIMFFEVPGTNASAVKAEVENNILTVECASTLQRNKRPVLFKRIFRLSKAVDVSKITATAADGVLKLHLPKADHVKPFRVPVA